MGVGLGVVVALADVGLEVGDDRAAHGAGGRPPAAAAALEWALEGALLAGMRPVLPAGSSAAVSRPTGPASAAPTAAPAPASPPLGLAPSIVPLSPRHRSSLG